MIYGFKLCYSPRMRRRVRFVEVSLDHWMGNVFPYTSVHPKRDCATLNTIIKEAVLNCVPFFFFSRAGPCHPNPCHNRGICHISETYRGDTFIGYICKCPPGFSGVHCQHSESQRSHLRDPTEHRRFFKAGNSCLLHNSTTNKDLDL